MAYFMIRKTPVSSSGVEIVPWAEGTDEQILTMVQAADAGEIDLTEYWNVGDERIISLSAMAATGVGESHIAQNVTMVLVAADNGAEDISNPCYNYQYVNATGGRAYPSFIVQQKNGLANGDSNSEYGYINSSSTNSGSWNGCARRTWCNSVYKSAVPSTLVDIFKQVNVKTAKTYNGTGSDNIQTSQDYFFLPAGREIFGDSDGIGTDGKGSGPGYSNKIEAQNLSQWEYYKTSSNRKKYRDSSSTAGLWWERSPYYDNSTIFCCVDTSGAANLSNASFSRLIAPCGCI